MESSSISNRFHSIQWNSFFFFHFDCIFPRTMDCHPFPFLPTYFFPYFFPYFFSYIFPYIFSYFFLTYFSFYFFFFLNGLRLFFLLSLISSFSFHSIYCTEIHSCVCLSDFLRTLINYPMIQNRFYNKLFGSFTRTTEQQKEIAQV